MLQVTDIQKSYEGKPLLKGISLSVGVGETVCLLGASGSGKSTLLRIIAGLESGEGGSVRWDGGDLTSLPAYRRGFGLVFQDYALFPHLDVFENTAFGLRMQGLPEKEIQRRVEESLVDVNLTGFEKRAVADLSGGEQQRVALARALAPRPRLLLFDEPLGALDRNLRETLMRELRRILHATKIPAIYVTHDQEEAFTLADRILFLHDGEIVRAGSPVEVWQEPGSAWVAGFLDVGNIVEGVARGDGAFETKYGIFSATCPVPCSAGQAVKLLVRPEGLLENRGDDFVGKSAGSIRGLVTDVIFHQDRFKVTVEGGLYFFLTDAPRIGQEIALALSASAIQCLS